jgi:hypothetical protein
MGTQVRVEWNGRAVKKDIERQINIGLFRAGIIIQSQAVPLANRDTGNLQNSIKVASFLNPGTFTDESTGRSRTIRPRSKTGLVGTIVFYAAPQESIKSYLGRAFRLKNRQAFDIIRDILKQSRFIR